MLTPHDVVLLPRPLRSFLSELSEAYENTNFVNYLTHGTY
jgi:hypothetical protein